MQLLQKFTKPINGFWDEGAKKYFYWGIDCEYRNGISRIGSMDANYWFEVKTGKTSKQTLANTRRSLRNLAKRKNLTCSFEYLT